MPSASAAFDIDATPWYRHPWPWLLLAGPAIVVVAAVGRMLLAMRSDDGLVAQDYYKRGLLINRELSKSQRAADVGAVVGLARDGTVRVTLQGGVPPTSGALRLLVVHPTREGLDRTIVLEPSADGLYVGRIAPLTKGRWLVTIDTDTWRLPTVEITAPLDTVRLGTAAAH
jgi:hypothetical protein